MATIKEDYVSFETAKLLKEKGMNKSCFKHYVQKNNDDGTSEAVTVCTPQMAMKWLREVHNIAIEFWCCDYKWQADFATLPKGIDIYTSFENTVFDTYEEAVEAAIKYCLENLI